MQPGRPGFPGWELAVPAGMNSQYTEGHRLMVAAWP